MNRPPGLLGVTSPASPTPTWPARLAPSSQLTTDPDLIATPGWGAAPAPPPSSATNPDPLGEAMTSTPGEPGDDSAQRASSIPASTDRAWLGKRSKAYAAIAGALLQTVGGMLNHAVALHSEDESFIPDDEDMEDIPPPLGRIAARRMKLGAVENLSDIEDIGMAVVGVTAWVAKGLSEAFRHRREARRLVIAAAEQAHDDAGQPQ